jgi:hypothetical protein
MSQCTTKALLSTVLGIAWLWIAGCHNYLPKREGAFVILPAADGHYTREQRIAALMSVRAHVTLDDELLEMVSTELPPLLGAAAILAADEGARADSRRLRSIASLEAFRLAQESGPITTERLSEIEEALRILGMDQERSAELRRRLVQLYPLLLQDRAGNVLPVQLNHSWLSLTLNQVIPDLFPSMFAALLTGPCWHRLEPPGPSVTPPLQWPVVLETNVSVNLPLKDVALNIDPQRWDECSEFWDPPLPPTTSIDDEATHLVVWTPGGAIAHPMPPAPGTHNPNPQLLHEEFSCGGLCANADFQLLLCVETRCDPLPRPGQKCNNANAFTVSYDLPMGPAGSCTCTSPPCPLPCNVNNTRWWRYRAKVGAQTTTPCMDYGYIAATKHAINPNRTVVSARKTLHFDPGDLTTTLSIILNLRLGAMNDELGDLACCFG